MGRKNNHAFTLVELIIVIAIVSFLAVMAISYFRGQLFKGNDARRKSDINRIQIALEEYEQDHNCYPLSQLAICSPGTGLRPYLENVPCDPVTKSSYYYEYEDSTCPRWYRIYSLFDNESDSSITPGIGPLQSFNYYKESPNAPDISEGTNAPPLGGEAGGNNNNDPPQGVVFYGCKAGACQEIIWDSSRPGPECDPNYQNSSCYGQCGSESTECVPWN